MPGEEEGLRVSVGVSSEIILSAFHPSHHAVQDAWRGGGELRVSVGV